MGINIIIAIIAGYLVTRKGWKRGLSQAVGYWVIISMVVVIFTTY